MLDIQRVMPPKSDHKHSTEDMSNRVTFEQSNRQGIGTSVRYIVPPSTLLVHTRNLVIEFTLVFLHGCIVQVGFFDRSTLVNQHKSTRC